MRSLILHLVLPIAGVLCPLAASAEGPIGTFTQHGRYIYEEKDSGYYDWDDTLIIRPDGTAEMRTRLDETLKNGWGLPGCDESVTSGSLDLRQVFTITVGSEVVSLDRQGPIEILRKEPSCWEVDQSSFADVFQDPWTLHWRNGRLSNPDGEYVRQE